MDILREVLGDEKLSYLGQSYGTRLVAVYAEMFPQNVRAMVLDGAIDPAQSTADRRVDQFTGFSARSTRWPRPVRRLRTVRWARSEQGGREVPGHRQASRRESHRHRERSALDFDAAYGAVVAGLSTRRCGLSSSEG